MRYYDLTITNASGATVGHITSHPNGLQKPPDPGALDMEFDVLVYDYAKPSGGSSITIYGVGLGALSQAQQFAGMTVALKGGMGKGLPLANPAQAGLLLAGNIFQSFGNWVGTQMTLDMVINPSTYTYDAPGIFVLNWPAGTPLATAIAQMLTAAYPKAKQVIQISSALVLPNSEWHYCNTLTQMASYIQGITAGMISPTYNGVSIWFQGGTFFVSDGTTLGSMVQIAFNDLIGQPTWIDVNVIQFKTVMRADIQMGQIVKMPTGLQNQPGVVTTTGQSQPSNSKYAATFQGQFTVTSVRHVGNFRSTDSAQWASIFTATPPIAPSNAG